MTWTLRMSQQTQHADPPAREPQRDPWARDRSRIIHSAAFRRLQAKTQILGLHQGDFYRTRLTHTLEVAQIGSGIVEFLHTQREKTQPHCTLCYDWLPAPYLIETICMGHDLGHPPFGHGGEVALNFMMRQQGGFEGNGQTLRILTKLGEHSEHHGQDLTRRALLGVMKYPVLYREVVRQDDDYLALAQRAHESVRLLNITPWHPPKCLLNEEASVRDWVLSPFSTADQQQFIQFEPLAGQHGKARYHALDTGIMDLADDIAYGVHDLEDAIALGIISEQNWRDVVLTNPAFTADTAIPHEQITQWLFSGQSRQRKRGISHLVGHFIRAISLNRVAEFEHPLLSCQVTMRPESAIALGVLKQLVWDYMISMPEIKAFEYKGQVIVMELFQVLHANSDRLLPQKTQQKLERADNEQARLRLLCDYLAGMTDDYAKRLYSKLFSPAEGSIFDRL